MVQLSVKLGHIVRMSYALTVQLRVIWGIL